MTDDMMAVADAVGVTPTVCQTCNGDGVVGAVDLGKSATMSWCPACRCPCGKPAEVTGGLCTECEDRVSIEYDTRYRRWQP